MRIAFLHPYKMSDHFFVEVIEAAAIADLCADGHDAEAVDFLFDPAKSELDQLKELREKLEAQAYDLIFLERAWSDDVVAALRGQRLVGWGAADLLDRGVEAVVVDTTREVARSVARAVAAGEPLSQVPGVAVKRSDGRVEQREGARKMSVLSELADATFAHGRRRSLTPAIANEHRAIVLSNLGCAYRNVPNKTGVFDGVEMPSEVSTAGCTFCDVEAYERMSDGDAVALIVRQVRAVLAQRPEVKEIAIKDDYAVRFIARLGDELRPLGLGDREVLLSARADYLLQLRSDIEEALAGRFPARLGFYLIGFENFAQPELDRFNKGISAAQMERVVALMREWSERFPGRFHVTPTGGFILFTPWTTLADLRVNADVMRRLGFSRFRGRALLSQLRLYPQLPLYWLAKRDGLLVESFERADQSDAARRGYEADHAWRFRDPKVAAVQRRLLDAASTCDEKQLFDVFEEALDEAAGVARGKKGRPTRMVASPNEVAKKGPATQQITLTRRCNQACTFCTHRGEDPTPPRQRAARAVQAVRAAAREGVRSVVLTGAEPTLEWYLKDLIKLARDLGVGEVALETNAIALEPHGGAAALDIDLARVALNSLDAEVSDAITRDPGGHARTLTGIRSLLDAGTAVELAVALLNENRGALVDIVTRAPQLFPGVSAIVARTVATGPAGFRPLPVREAAEQLRDAVAAAERSGIALRIAVDGELPPCVFEEPTKVLPVLRVGRVLLERSGDRHRRIEACERCAAREVCPGPLADISERVAAVAKPLRAEDPLEGIIQVSQERSRQLREYKSSFFVDSHDGGVVERRIVRVNFHCNQACDFCFVSRELPPIEHEVIEREIREVARTGAVLDLSGGEPTLNPRLPEYIRLATSSGVRELDLQTNAIKMSDRAYAQELYDAGLRQAFVSLHGITPKVSDRVTAAPGTFVRTVAGVKNLLSLGVSVRLNFVLCGYNVQELAQFPAFASEELGGKNLVANFSFVAASTDNVPRDTKLIPRFRDVAWALERAHAGAVERGLRWTGFDSKCGVPACYLPRAIRDTHFTHDIPDEERARATGFTKSEVCARCELDKRCYGIRSTYATMYGVDELRPIRNGEVVEERRKQRGGDARLTDDAAFARLPVTWSDEHGGGGPHREIVQLHAGLRSVIKTERPSTEAAQLAADGAIASGMKAKVFSDPRSRRAIAFIGLSEAAVDEAVEVERQINGSFRDRLPLVLRMGELLGYPACCVEAFAKSAEQTDGATYRRLALSQHDALSFEQNWVPADIRAFSHFPCTPTCERTAMLARRTLEAIEKERPDYAKALVRALSSVSLIAADGQYALLEGSRADGPDAYTYERVLSHRNLGVDDWVLGRASFRAFYLAVVAPLEKGNRVVRRGASLVVERDGRSIAELRFDGETPWLLDFTAPRLLRRLPVM
jgi:MoaA/NifB/PqqE/SkfB family radical SAM enzyme